MKKFIAIIGLFIVLLASCTQTPLPQRGASTNEFSYPTALTYGEVTENSIDFTWDAVTDAPRYRVWLSTNKDMSDGKFQRSTGNSTHEDFYNLTNNTTYYAKVRVITEDGQNLSPYSPAISVKTFTPVDPAPVPNDPAPPTADDNKVTKVLSIWFENKSYAQVDKGMPFLKGLGEEYSIFRRWKATTHPSNPNYIDATFGSTFGVAKNSDAGKGRFAYPTVFGQAIKNGKTAKEYVDWATSNCVTKSGGNRVESRHIPWPHSKLAEERVLCKKFSVPYKGNFVKDSKNGNFPNVGLLVPNDCNNAHDCSLKTADNWLKKRWEYIVNSPDWKSGHLAVNIVFDEDDKRSGNIVYSVVAHPSLHGVVSDKPMNHNSLTRAWNQVGNTPYMRGAKTAGDMLDALGLTHDNPS